MQQPGQVAPDPNQERSRLIGRGAESAWRLLPIGGGRRCRLTHRAERAGMVGRVVAPRPDQAGPLEAGV